MSKICKNCGCYEVCIFANPCRTEDCKHGWQPIIVQCKDCKHWKPGNSFGGDSFDKMERIGGCGLVKFARMESGFCDYGERKDNDKE